MPTLIRACAGLLLAAACASGCASGLFRASLSEPVPYFSGAGFDAVCIVAPILEDPRDEGAAKLEPVAWAMLAPFCVLDLPLSVSLDTLLLPVDVWAHERAARPRPAATKAPDGASSSPDRAG